jgi:hypothetical protein
MSRGEAMENGLEGQEEAAAEGQEVVPNVPEGQA